MFAVITLKFKQRGISKEKMSKWCRLNANSVDHDQAAPRSSQIWVCTFAKAYLSENLGPLSNYDQHNCWSRYDRCW